jgi:hypothetical protein
MEPEISLSCSRVSNTIPSLVSRTSSSQIPTSFPYETF